MKPESKEVADNNSRAGKRLFVVKGKESSTRVFETFLKNRDWQVSATTELKKALVSILSQPLDYVMISVDHPNQKCLRLPGIISQTSRVPVILFAEGSTQGGINYLRNSKHPYILYPPVSGPAIERMILKIERDKTSQSQDAFGDQGAIINVGGATKTGALGDYRSTGTFSMEDAVRLFEGDGSFGSTAEGGALRLKGETTAEGVDTSSGISHQKTDLPKPDPAKKNIAEHDDLDKKNLVKNSGLEKNDDLEKNASLEKNNQTMKDQNFGGNNRGPLKSSESGTAPTSKQASQGGTPGKSMSHNQGNDDSYSVLVKGAEHALSMVALVSENDRPMESASLKTCTRVSCFDIHTAQFSGYLVVAFGAEREVDAFFNESLRENLSLYLHQNGIPITPGELLDLKLKEVCFEDWSMTEALFLRKAVHRDNEIALAFFPQPEKESPLELSIESHMCKMKLQEIRANTDLEFDVYLYFPANQKYIRYAAKNRQIPDGQKNKLLGGGHQEVHVRKDTEKDVMRYRVQNFLNDKITAFSDPESRAKN